MDVLKRGKGKKVKDFGKDYIYTFYKENSKKPIDKSMWGKFTKDFLKEISTKIVTENLITKLPSLGKIRILSKKQELLTKEGKIKNFYTDWKATREYWKIKYGTDDLNVLKSIPNKICIPHENNHTNGEVACWFWEKNNYLKNQHLYFFIASRDNKRHLAKIMKDPNRNVFYYG